MTNRVILNNETATDFLRQLKKSKVQYKPLSKAKERELIDSLRYKDETKLRHLLVMHNLKIVYNLSRKYAKNTMDFDDLIARGFYGLCRAATDFDFDAVVMDKKTKKPLLDKNGNTIPIKFITYARPWVFKYIVIEFQQKGWKVIEKSSSLDGFSNSPIGDDITTQDVEEFLYGSTEPSQFRRQEDAIDHLSGGMVSDIYSDALDCVKYNTSLSSDEKAIFSDIYVENMTMKSVAEKWNIDMEMLNTVSDKVMGKVRDYITRKYSIASIDQLID